MERTTVEKRLGGAAKKADDKAGGAFIYILSNCLQGRNKFENRVA
jgi:hypothetical protein